MRRSMQNLQMISLTDEEKKAIMEEIHDFFDAEYGEDIGIIKQQHILDLFMKQLAPMIYNKALDDTMIWYKRQRDNMETDFYTLYKEVR